MEHKIGEGKVILCACFHRLGQIILQERSSRTYPQKLHVLHCLGHRNPRYAAVPEQVNARNLRFRKTLGGHEHQKA